MLQIKIHYEGSAIVRQAKQQMCQITDKLLGTLIGSSKVPLSGTKRKFPVQVFTGKQLWVAVS